MLTRSLANPAGQKNPFRLPSVETIKKEMH
jgi:hypothetical protein